MKLDDDKIEGEIGEKHGSWDEGLTEIKLINWFHWKQSIFYLWIGFLLLIIKLLK